MDWMKLWPAGLLILTNLVDQYEDLISAWIAGHPKVALVITGLVTLIANVVKSPIKPVT
ncbi:MAG: hypothetical protein ACYCZR_00950 [Burkholderiales bacterium]